MGEGERYEEFAPPETLRPFVRLLWTYAAPRPSGGVQRIAPDGCPELVVDLAAAYEEQDADGAFRLQPPVIFAGQMTRPMAIRPVGPVEIVAAKFEPDGAREFLGRPLIEATDRRLDLVARLDGFAAPSGDPAGQAAALGSWLEEQRRAGDWRIDSAVRAQVAAAEDDLEAPPLNSAERRALQRRFRDRVGVAPRTLRSVFRFRRIFDHAMGESADAASWLEAGLAAGYFDQPQMARDFRRFLGCTATAWAREQVELARRLASHSYKPAP
ncbi:Transcriptional regulator, AraC family [Brevundimonas diminuta 3F5N]|uniref:Transcriptional regulator, AraC family n=1 Tax=Brevundimonas diminuta 3F5N TaxID=1255603 RepID=A0A1R4F2M0_BREDI|nr:helix-turn-helix domain-containing protein [Brevundimonas diminuta]SJM50063.1 Transcriptional regulator, AraC family [Brevundimonas diminuta 3F5N]